MVSKQSTKDLTLRGWSLLNVVLLVITPAAEKTKTQGIIVKIEDFC